MMQNFHRLGLLLLILLACGLRIYRLEAQSLWYDEAVTAVIAQFPLPNLIRWTADDIQPPLYYLLVSAWGNVGGWGEWSLRFPSALFGVLAVPLMAQVARRLSGSRSVALLTGLLTALHPLLVYYSQEARMYSLLLALGIALIYAQGRAEMGQPRAWIAYALLGTAAAYTHYFAFFLIAGLGMIYLLGRRPHPVRFALANGAILILYLPWFRVLFNRLAVDTSYWEGSLKLWEALRHTAIRFALGESVLEASAIPWLWLYAGITALALWQIARRRGDGRLLAYGLGIALVPVIGVLTLASITPKFNPRYVILALPGLLLLWSSGLIPRSPTPRSPIPQYPNTPIPNTQYPIPTPSLLPTLLLLPILAGFALSLHNWYTQPAFAKDQWRELAAHVQAHRQPDEAVLLVSGHAWPAWDYYAAEIPAARLPDLPILDVNAVVDFANSGQILPQALAGKSGVWLVNWQDEVIDPMGVTRMQLEQAGEALPVDAGFWGLSLARYRLDAPDQIRAQPPIAEPTALNFGDQIEFLGHTVAENGDLRLFWRRHPQSRAGQAEPDLYLSGLTRSPQGAFYGQPPDRRLAVFDYPVFRWQPGQVTVTVIPAIQWAGPGAPAGNYRFRLGVYEPGGDPAGLDLLGVDGLPQGKQTTLTVDLPLTLPLTDAGENWPEIAPGLHLSAAVEPSAAASGQEVDLTLFWFGQEAREIREVTLAWVQAGGIVAQDRLSVDRRLAAGEGVRLVERWQIPPDLPPGAYELVLGVEGATAPLALPVTVLPSQIRYDLPPVGQSVDARFGPAIELVGLAESLPATVTGDAPLDVTLIWQAAAQPEVDYTVSLQWLGEAGRPVAQIDLPLPGPSSGWQPGQVTVQEVAIPLPPSPGRYPLVVAVYDGADPAFPRLTLADGADLLRFEPIERQ